MGEYDPELEKLLTLYKFAQMVKGDAEDRLDRTRDLAKDGLKPHRGSYIGQRLSAIIRGRSNPEVNVAWAREYFGLEKLFQAGALRAMAGKLEEAYPDAAKEVDKNRLKPASYPVVDPNPVLEQTLKERFDEVLAVYGKVR